ncbi:MAG: hypothetical protein AB7S93_14910 [Xanthobacteraceae bacterium]
MRATVKFAVICLSLLIAGPAEAVDRRNPSNTLSFQERGARLRIELDRAYQDLRRTGKFKSAGNDVSSIVKKYVPVGTSFANAEIVLRSSGFTMDAAPPRDAPANAMFGTLVLAQRGISRMTVEITLLPKVSETDQNTVKSVQAVLHYRGV